MTNKLINKYFLLFVVILFSFENVPAQSLLQQVLQRIEANNKTLKAAQQLAEVQRIDAKTDIYPSDVKVGYEHVFGNGAASYQDEKELTIVQDFDFPTAYFQKNKMANIKSNQADVEYCVVRQDILLETKIICIELVYLNKNRVRIEHLLENTGRLAESYQKQLEIGDVNVLEANKIALEFLNIKNESRMNDAEIANRLRKLAGLNGGEYVGFADTIYLEPDFSMLYDDMLQKSLEADLQLKTLEQEKDIASKSVGLAKSMALPKFSVGYKMVVSNPERFNGFIAGLSIPLWENKNTIKREKAKEILAGLKMDDMRTFRIGEFKQMFDKAMTLKQSYERYKELLFAQNNWNYLSKSLSLGQISLHEYLTEMNFLYQSAENYLQIERDYHLIMAELLKTEL